MNEVIETVNRSRRNFVSSFFAILGGIIGHIIFCFILSYLLATFFLLCDFTLFSSVLVTFITAFSIYFVCERATSNSWLPYIATLLAVLWVVNYGPDDKAMANMIGMTSDETSVFEDLLVLGDRISVDLILKVDPSTACGAAETQFKEALKDQEKVDPRNMQVSFSSYNSYSPYHVTCNYNVWIDGESEEPFFFNLKSWENP